VSEMRSRDDPGSNGSEGNETDMSEMRRGIPGVNVGSRLRKKSQVARSFEKWIEPLLAKIADEKLRCAVRKYLKYHWNEFSTIPASIRYHHTEEGGLLQHTVEVCNIGLQIIEALCLDVSIDYFVTAALLHDVGKIQEYRYDHEAKAWVHSEKRRYDHSLQPLLDFYEITGYDLPKPVKFAILSHMGGWSQTSVYPDTLLEAVLHVADLVSSRR